MSKTKVFQWAVLEFSSFSGSHYLISKSICSHAFSKSVRRRKRPRIDALPCFFLLAKKEVGVIYNYLFLDLFWMNGSVFGGMDTFLENWISLRKIMLSLVFSSLPKSRFNLLWVCSSWRKLICISKNRYMSPKTALFLSKMIPICLEICSLEKSVSAWVISRLLILFHDRIFIHCKYIHWNTMKTTIVV